MKIEIRSNLRITDPSQEIEDWCKKNLEVANPEYQKKIRMHLWTGNTPSTLFLYSQVQNNLILPFGCLRELVPMLQNAEVQTSFISHEQVDYEGEVPLYDYQNTAVSEMIENVYGILQSPAGSGKTQMGLAIASRLKVPSLWITHTRDLLLQSKQRAEQFFDPSLLGTITEGKINIGKTITFATIQTLSNINLLEYQDFWDCVIVDECHRVCGTPTSVTRFSKVLNVLNAKHKYGLSATVHRADGLIKATYALLGQIVHTVPTEATQSKVMKVTIQPRSTEIGMSPAFLNTDGTINYSKMINYLTANRERNHIILKDLLKNENHSNLILSDRVNHLRSLYELLPSELQSQAAIIDGRMTSKKKKAEREKAIDEMRKGEKRYLFATYSLAKEGLDIPILDRLYLTTPQRDYAVIVQSTGRIARFVEGKSTPLAYDYVDPIRSLEKSYKNRCTSYRKCNYSILKEGESD